MESNEGEIKFEHQQWCVFYDRGSGRVVHVHEYLARSRDNAVTAGELIEQARRTVGDRLDHERVRVFHPPEGMRLDANAIYAVDVKEGKLFVADTIASERTAPRHRGGFERKRPNLL